jgi:hypothetical protein
MKHINKPAMTLALLLAAATGAWAQIAVTRTGGQNKWTFSMPESKVELAPTYFPRAAFSKQPAALENVTAGTAAAIISAGESAQGTLRYFVTADANATAPAIGDGAWSTALPTAAVITGDVAEDATAYVYYYIVGNDGTVDETFSNSEVQGPLAVTLLKNLYTATFTPQKVAITILGGKATVAVGEQAASFSDAETIGSLKQGQAISITAAAGYTVGTITLNGNDAEATYTEGSTVATFTMPQGDVTVAYTLQRSMSNDMAVQMGNGSAGLSYTIKKEGGIWVPEEMTRAQLLALFAVTDNKAGAPKTTLTLGEDYDVQLYKIDESGQPVGSPVASAQFDFAPGRYAMKAVTLGPSSMYSGETALSNTFTLAATDLPGDIPIPGGERDGVVDADDVDNFFELMFSGQLPKSTDPTFVLFDVNGDGFVDIADLQGIANIAVGLNWDGSIPANARSLKMERKASQETDKK